ncbi:MAG: S-adenosylmethionine:tRNA ribosyltransferase-isomerase [Gemmatimonadaceae bacterium]
MTTLSTGVAFSLPDELAAHEPPEARGLSRDSVRLMVSRAAADDIAHSAFADLPEILERGDLLVVNTSATLNAAFESERQLRDGRRNPVMVHLSSALSGSRWVIELRRQSTKGASPLLDAESGEVLGMPGGAEATLVQPYSRPVSHSGGFRLWVADLRLPTDHLTYSRAHGSPIRYSYVPGSWPLSYYQTVFAADPGSAEMPSAGRPFTERILDRLKSRGVGIARVTLHTGVSSLDAGEEPYPERYQVPASAARAVNRARMAGGRVIAVGTTVVRALEAAASAEGIVRPSEGWTDLVVTPDRGIRAVNAMLTGLHAPQASHLAMLEALAGTDHIARAYELALSERYLWHEFGDVHLILP